MNNRRCPTRVGKKNTSYKISIYVTHHFQWERTLQKFQKINLTGPISKPNGRSSFRSEILASIIPFENILGTCFRDTEPKIKGLNQTQLQRNSQYRSTSWRPQRLSCPVFVWEAKRTLCNDWNILFASSVCAEFCKKWYSDLGISSDLCSVEITGSDIRRISVSSVDTRPNRQEEPNDRIFPDTSEVFPSEIYPIASSRFRLSTTSESTGR